MATTKNSAGKQDDSPLHSAAKAGDLIAVKQILTGVDDDQLGKMLSKQNQSGETALYVASDCGNTKVVKELVKHYDVATGSIKAKNGFDAFHVAAKRGDLDTLTVLLDALPDLSLTADASNTTSLNTAATQGHAEVVTLLLDSVSSLSAIAKSNGKTPLHCAARNGHVEVVRVLLRTDRGIVTRVDKKGQTALHMAVKGQSLHVVQELIAAPDPYLINMVDAKGNNALHIATRKGRFQIVRMLVGDKRMDTGAINNAGETAVDTAEKTGNHHIAGFLREQGLVGAESLTKFLPSASPVTGELKHTVSEIKQEVHDQMHHTRQTRRRVHGIAKRVHKMHSEGLNNAINSTTVVAVLIATVAFAAIFTVPGQYVDERDEVRGGMSMGEANIAGKGAFVVFFIFDSVALFISLAVVVVQTSVVVIESRAKKKLMAVINKVMWVACVLISASFLALAFVVVGEQERWLAVGVTVVGTTIMATTLGTLAYWVVRHRREAANLRSVRRSSIGSRSSMSVVSDSEIVAAAADYKKILSWIARVCQKFPPLNEEVQAGLERACIGVTSHSYHTYIHHG